MIKATLVQSSVPQRVPRRRPMTTQYPSAPATHQRGARGGGQGYCVRPRSKIVLLVGYTDEKKGVGMQPTSLRVDWLPTHQADGLNNAPLRGPHSIHSATSFLSDTRNGGT